MVGLFVEVCRIRGLKVNGNKRKVTVLGGEEDWSARFVWMGRAWRKCQSSNI